MMSANMKAAVLSTIGGPEGFKCFDDIPIPELQEGTVIVKNKISSINYADVYFRTGIYPSARNTDLILGQEAAGVIVAAPVDEPLGFRKGDRVVWIAQGAYAQYTRVPTSQIIKIPQGVEDEDAAGVFLAGMTALTLIGEAFPAKAGDWALVHAAAGGVGLLLCQALKSLGAVVIGTAGGPEKCQLALQNGASHVIDYRAEKDWPKRVLELTGGRGVDVAYDGVGKDTWEGTIQTIGLFGKAVFIGNASGAIPAIGLEKLTAKNISLIRPTLRNYISTRHRLERYGNMALEMVQQGKWKILKHDHYYSLEEVEQAHRDLENRATKGKLLIRL